MSTKAAKQKRIQENDLESKYSFMLTKRQMIILWNMILPQQFKIGDGYALFPFVAEMEKILAVETNIPQEEEPKEKVDLHLKDN